MANTTFICMLGRLRHSYKRNAANKCGVLFYEAGFKRPRSFRKKIQLFVPTWLPVTSFFKRQKWSYEAQDFPTTMRLHRP